MERVTAPSGRHAMRMTWGIAAGCIMLGWVVCVDISTSRAQDPAIAQDTLGDAGANAADQSTNSLEAEDRVREQVDLRSFQSPDLLAPTERLFGDWGGLIPRLKDSGITPSLTFVSDLAGNPCGGLRQGFTECDNLGFDMSSDLNKLVGMEGATFHLSMSQRSGNSLTNEYIGNAINVQQVWGGETYKLIDVEYIQHWFDNHLSFHGGRIATGDDFLSSPYYWFFVSNGICGNPVGIFKNAPGMSAYPNATWGSRLRWRPTDNTYVMAGVYNGDPTIRDNDEHGANFSVNGPAFFISEAGWKYNNKPEGNGKSGTLKFGAWYDGNRFDNFNRQLLGDSAAQFGVLGETRTGNWGYYALADQIVYIQDREAKRGIGIFAAILVSPEQDISTMPLYVITGCIYRGPLVLRPDDALGFAVIYGEFSDSLRNAEKLEKTTDPTVHVQGAETVLELSYRFRIKGGRAYFQPDLQYVIHPNGYNTTPNAFVVGSQVGFNF
jgi:porin